MQILNRINMLGYIYLPPVYWTSELLWGPIFQLFSVKRNLLERKAEILIIARSCHILRVLQWNHNCWQYCEECLCGYCFPSVKEMCYKLRYLSKMMLCRYRILLENLLTPPPKFAEHGCNNCCIQPWYRIFFRWSEVYDAMQLVQRAP